MARMANRYRLDRRGAGCSRPLYQQLGHSRRWGGTVIFIVVALAGIILAVILTRSLG